MASIEDKTYMSLALTLAEKGRGKAAPNPMVGAVLVKNDTVIATGYHRKAGGDHAEIAALKQAGSKANNATLYVTLEPCCHTGRTGPCTEAIINAGVTRVVFPLKDPNHQVNGKGAQILRKAGIKVSTGMLKKEASRQNEIYLHRFKAGKPFVILKLAQSLDGSIATASGDSKYLSSKESLTYVHQLRAEVDAVIVGGNTARKDNPQLNVRHVQGKDPYRIVATTNPDSIKNIQILKQNDDFKTIIATSSNGIKLLPKPQKNRPLIYWSVKSSGGKLNPHDLLQKATAFEIQSILLEGGSALASSFIKASLVDKYIFVNTPRIIGNGIPAVGDVGVRSIALASKLEIARAQPFGDDIIIQAYPVKNGKGF